MTIASVVFIFVAFTLSCSLAQNQAENSQTNGRAVMDTSAKAPISPTANIQPSEIQRPNLDNLAANINNLFINHDNIAPTNSQPRTIIGKTLDKLVQNVTNLMIKVEHIDNKLNEIMKNLSAEIQTQTAGFSNTILNLSNQVKAQNMELNGTLQGLSVKVASMDPDVSKKVEKLSTKVTSTGTDLNRKFDSLSDKVNSQQTKMDENVEKLSTKVGTLSTSVTNLENQCEKAETLNSSLQTVVNKVDDLAGAVRFSNASKTISYGLLIGTSKGVTTIDLNSGKKSQIISTNEAALVAFDWNTRKVYWAEAIGFKRANLDGTDVKLVEPILEDYILHGLAVDSITGNFYYLSASNHGELSTFTIKVCSGSGWKCSVVAREKSPLISIALYPSKGIMFWSNPSKGTVVRANMDGTNATVFISELVAFVSVNEDLDRLYWTGDGVVGSHNLDGNDRKVLVKTPARMVNVATHGRTVYLVYVEEKTINSVSTEGGKITHVANLTQEIISTAVYGSQPLRLQSNPCERSECSQLCVLKQESFACMCPQGRELDQGGKDCV